MRQLDLVKNEKGFTLIELLVACSIISILSALSICSFIIYKQNAEYAKGSATMRNVRTALKAGQLDLPDDYTLAYTQSSTTGGVFTGELAKALPGGNVADAVRIGVEINTCDESSDPLDRADFLVSEPCRGTQEVRWQRFCGGTEILLEHVANPAPCT